MQIKLKFRGSSSRHLRLLRVAAASLAVVLILAAVAYWGIVSTASGSRISSWFRPDVDPDSAANTVPRHAGGRQVYPYSVIPGGVVSRDELLRAIQSDPIVAAHYRGFKAERAQAMKLNSPRLAHVSYRVGDKVYWTKKQVLIRSGETVLSDGANLVRGRCGNRIAEIPGPVLAAGEPPEVAFNGPPPPAVASDRPIEPVILAAAPLEPVSSKSPLGAAPVVSAAPVGQGIRIWPFLLPVGAVPAIIWGLNGDAPMPLNPPNPPAAAPPVSGQPAPAAPAVVPDPQDPSVPSEPLPTPPEDVPVVPPPPVLPAPAPSVTPAPLPPPLQGNPGNPTVPVPVLRPSDPNGPPVLPRGNVPPPTVVILPPNSPLLPLLDPVGPPNPEPPSLDFPQPETVVTPEPGFYGMLAVGLCGLLFFSRRNRQ